MKRKEQFMEKLCKAMDKHGYRPDPLFITKLEQMPEELFEKALDCVFSPDVNVSDEDPKKKV